MALGPESMKSSQFSLLLFFVLRGGSFWLEVKHSMPIAKGPSSARDLEKVPFMG